MTRSRAARPAAIPALLATVAALLVGATGRADHAQFGDRARAGWSHATRAVGATGIADPAQNIAPNPDYWPTCSSQGPSSSACTDAVVAAINNARAAEGVKPMTLPSGFAQMSPAVQTFVVSNLERVDRGLSPAAGMVGTLNSAAQTAANNDADPTLASWTIDSFSANTWGSIWAGDLNTLAADYDWMYNDGWSPTGSINLDCTTATASGCWGHRDNILSTYGGEQLITGVAATAQSQWLSIAQIFVAGSGSYPAFTTAWSAVSRADATTAPPSSTDTTPTNPAPTNPPVDPTISKLGASASVVWAGHSVTLTGHLIDATTALPVADAPVQLCAVTRNSAPACTSTTTDANGMVVSVAKPSRRTTYWLSFAGSNTLAPSTSTMRTVLVRAAGRLHSASVNGQRLIAASLTPASGQSLRLQRWTSRGWVAVRITSASRSVLIFSRLAQGVYRLVISTGQDVLGSTTAAIRG